MVIPLAPHVAEQALDQNGIRDMRDDPLVQQQDAELLGHGVSYSSHGPEGITDDCANDGTQYSLGILRKRRLRKKGN